MPDGAALAHLDGISVRFGRTDVLRDVHLVVEPGAVVGLQGPNGSGKSTLLRVLATLTRPTAGAGRVLGATLASHAVRAVRGRIGLLAHYPALYPELTLLENLTLVAQLSGRDTARVVPLLEGVGLGAAAHRRVDRSSHGMQRRVDIARLFLTEPDLLLLDEAHAGLDAAASSLIGTLVTRTTRKGGAAVLVSHDVAHLDALTTRVVELEAGSLVEVAR